MTTAVDRPSSAQRYAVLRWKLGHHVFHVLLVTMNTRLNEAISRLEAEEWEATRAALLDLARLYDAATAAMRYAADFSSMQYKQLIRPSMMPPFASEGFSGVHNTEHATMLAGVRTLRRLYKKVRADAPEPVHLAWQRLVEAQRANQNNHMYVCRRFVAEGTSLLQRHYSRQRESDS